jgi:hypothetical protein
MHPTFPAAQSMDWCVPVLRELVEQDILILALTGTKEYVHQNFKCNNIVSSFGPRNIQLTFCSIPDEI